MHFLNILFIEESSKNRMISEESCDTEDWSNGCWNISFAKTGKKYILKYRKTETIFIFILIIFHNIAKKKKKVFLIKEMQLY